MIEEPYTLFTRIPLIQGPDGAYFTNDLWEKDLSFHFKYIAKFHICCPIIKMKTISEHLIPVKCLKSSQVFDLKKDIGWGSVLLNIIPNFLTVGKAIKESEIVHSSGSGWSFPLSYYILYFRAFRKFKWIMIIESSFWMNPKDAKISKRRKLSESIHRYMIKKCLKHSDARIFTQKWYREQLLGETDRSLIAPASWVDSKYIISESGFFSEKTGNRFIFPSRMDSNKGVDIVIEALKIYNESENAQEIFFDFIGDGPLTSKVRSFTQTKMNHVKINYLSKIPYGLKFFKLLSEYDAVIVASQTEEQPRIILDSFSQGVPCIASSTSGNSSLIINNHTGILFKSNSPNDLANILLSTLEHSERLQSMGRNAIQVAKKFTHEAMHLKREVFIKNTLDLK